MNLRREAKNALDDVSAASTQVIESTQWATVALVAVAAVSVVALLVGMAALSRAGTPYVTAA